MYTVIITGKTLNRLQNSLVVNIDVTTNGETFPVNLSLASNSTFVDVQRAIKRYIERLEAADTAIAAITEGAIDLATVSEETQTQAQIDKVNWFANFRKLEQVQKLITLGALTGNETQVVNLRNSVKDDFKPAYIADM